MRLKKNESYYLFFVELLKGKGKKRYFEYINMLHLQLFPEYKNNPNQSAHLWEILEFLAENKQLTLPSTRGKAWRLGQPRLPEWVSIRKTALSITSTIPENYAWHPKIAIFVDQLNVKQREIAYIISDYLKQHVNQGQFELSIPRRERSLKIFGDEKRLDSLANKGFIFSGYLRLEDLGCHDIGWPMPCRMPSDYCPNKPFLIVENHHTYESFSKWNEVARHYSGIGYGAGEAFSTVETDHIDNIITPTGASEIHYFGDIDPKGINIPARVSKARVARNLQPILPALGLYQWLLDQGIERTFSKKKQLVYVKDWLPNSFGKRITKLFFEQKWYPQEALGFEELQSGLINVSYH